MDHFYNSSIGTFNSDRFYHPHSAEVRATVAVSACLTGERVRYDGNTRYLPAVEWLGAALHLVPICPEVGAGLTVPRPPVQLVVTDGPGAMPHALGRDDPNLDVTPQLQAFALTSSTQLIAAQTLCGYLWKSRSPSCGYGSAPLFNTAGIQIGQTNGIQAAHFQRALPWLSYCEESNLLDTETALAFVLRCRLVFDWMYAGATELFAQHQHYRFLLEQLTHNEQMSLTQLAIANNRTDYLAVLQRSCARLPTEQLLKLFIS
jgi:uncharacterized protein YbbK (DUF523 family)